MANLSPPASALAAFNAAPPEAAERDLLACCASAKFAKAIADGRPYAEPDALSDAVDTAFASLSWDDIVESMNAHPRIGDRPAPRRLVDDRAVRRCRGHRPGPAGPGRREPRLRGALRPRFPHLRHRPFRAGDAGPAPGKTEKRSPDRTGRGASGTAEDHPAAAGQAAEPMTLSTHVLDATTGRPAAGVRVRLERAGDAGGRRRAKGRPAPTDGCGCPAIRANRAIRRRAAANPACTA